jgi:hypothetical protein
MRGGFPRSVLQSTSKNDKKARRPYCPADVWIVDVGGEELETGKREPTLDALWGQMPCQFAPMLISESLPCDE